MAEQKTGQRQVKRMFTRQEEHQILINTIHAFILTGFAFLGLGWYWLTTRVLILNPLQQAVMFFAFGVFTITLILLMLLLNYEFNKHGR